MDARDELQALRRELSALRSSHADLERVVASAKVQIWRLERIIESIPGAVWESEGVPGQPSYRMPYVSGQVEEILGYTLDECRGTTNFWNSIVHPDDREQVGRDLAAVATTGGRLSRFRFIAKDGREVWVDAQVKLNHDENGAIVGRCVIAPDVSERVRAERERDELKDKVLKAQEAALIELSTPLMPISAQVLVMPLIGTIDAPRANRIIEALLARVSSSRARVAILDVTGVPTLDAPTADALLRAASGVRLLGAEVVLTGVRPEVAKALTALGADLHGIATRGTLESGIAYAKARR